MKNTHHIEISGPKAGFPLVARPSAAEEARRTGFGEDGRPVVLAAMIGDHAPHGSGMGDSSLSELVDKVKRDFGSARVKDVADELLDLLADEGWLSSGGGLAVDEDSALGKLASLHRKAWRLLISYQENQKPKLPKPANGIMFTQDEMMGHIQSAFDKSLMSSRAMALELGFAASDGFDMPAQMARKFGYGKFTFCKCCENFQVKLGLPKRPGQRDEEACDEMSRARKKQVDNKSNGGLAR